MVAPAATPAGTNMEQVSGSFLELTAPDYRSIKIEDVAHGLSLQHRVLGQTLRPYSVAEHCVNVALLLEADGETPELQLAGLLHDAHEAYIGDVPTPVKRTLQITCPGFEEAWKALEINLDLAIAKALGSQACLFRHDKVKSADIRALRAEAYRLMPSAGEGWHWPDGIDMPELDLDRALTHNEARDAFLATYSRLTQGRVAA